MKKILMIYNIPYGNDSIRISFNRELFNYRIQSNKGKFDKKSVGILKIYERPLRSTVIFEKNQLDEVKKLCEKFKIENKLYEIKEL
jgi:hypothetical protein